MLKISRAALNTLAETSSEIGALFEELEVAHQDFMDRCQTVVDKIDEAKSSAMDIMENSANDAEEYHGDKSEKWQEGERGQAYYEWMGRLREISDAMQDAIDLPEVSMPERPEWVDNLADPDFSEFEYEG